MRTTLARIPFLKDAYHTLRLLQFRAGNLLAYRDPEVFGNICIETDSRCNRKCGNCPVAYYPRPQISMPGEVFERIISQLAARDYKGEIAFFWYNEPLLDQRLAEFIRVARQKCPQSYIYIATNGDFLDSDVFRTLVRAGLSHLYISRYDDRVEPHLKDFLERLDESDKRHYTLRFVHNFCNRAGALKGKEIQRSLTWKCGRPDFQMIVNAEGKAVLCCNDYFGEEVLGHVADENVFDIWKKQRFRYIRAQLRKGHRKNIALCSRCDLAFGGYFLPRSLK